MSLLATTDMDLKAIRPPYHRLIQPDLSRRPVPGEVLVARVESHEFDDELRHSLGALRSARPWAHILVQLRRPWSDTLAPLLAPAIGACAITDLPELGRDALVRLLSPRNTSTAIHAWITERSPGLAPDLADFVRQIVAKDAACSEAVRASDRLRKKFRDSGIPSPDAIWRLHRTMPPLLALQRDLSRSQLRTAIEGGFADHSALNRASVRLFGRTPGSLRSTAGWRWMLWLWWTRAVPGIAKD